MPAGADAADQMDAAFRRIIENDPDIQRVIQRVWGAGPRPSDTPGHLEQANHQASQEITQILKSKGIDLPDRTFINPRSGTIEGHRGWSGLNNWQKGAIIAAAAVGTAGIGTALAGGAGGAALAGGGAGAAGAGGGGGAALASGLGVTSGLGTLAGVGTTGVLAGGGAAALAGGIPVTAGLGGATFGSTVPVGGSSMAGGGGLVSRLGGLLRGQGNVGRLLETGGAIASGIGESAAEDRRSGIDYQLLRDRLGIDTADANERQRMARADLELRQQAEGRTAQNNAFTNSMRSSILGNFQMPQGVPGRTNIQFLNPGMIAQGKSAADVLGPKAMDQLRTGSQFTPQPAHAPYALQSPLQMPGASTTERIADIVGLVGTGVGNAMQPRQQVGIEQWLEALRR